MYMYADYSTSSKCYNLFILDCAGVPSPQLALSPNGSVSSSQLDLDCSVMSAFRKDCTVCT